MSEPITRDEIAAIIKQHVWLSEPSFDIARPRRICGAYEAADAVIARIGGGGWREEDSSSRDQPCADAQERSPNSSETSGKADR